MQDQDALHSQSKQLPCEKKQTYTFSPKKKKEKKAWTVLYFAPENTLKDIKTSLWYQRCCKNSKIQGKTHQILFFLNSCQSLK